MALRSIIVADIAVIVACAVWRSTCDLPRGICLTLQMTALVLLNSVTITHRHQVAVVLLLQLYRLVQEAALWRRRVPMVQQLIPLAHLTALGSLGRVEASPLALSAARILTHRVAPGGRLWIESALYGLLQRRLPLL